MTGARICGECEGVVAADSRFCAQCGAAVQAQTSPACGECGAPMDADAKFCDQCGASSATDDLGPDVAIERPGARAEDPNRESRGPVRTTLGIVAAAGALIVGLMQLSDSNRAPKFEVIDVTPPPRGPDAKTVRAKPAPRALTETETMLAGTWVARAAPWVVDPGSIDTTLVGMKAIRAGSKPEMPKPCLWFELYDNLTGFRHECVLIDGEPSIFERTQAMSGSKQAVGLALTWRFDGRLHITYDEPMVIAAESGLPRLEVRSITFEQIPQTQPIETKQTFAEHPDLEGRTVAFEVRSGGYLGDPPPTP